MVAFCPICRKSMVYWHDVDAWACESCGRAFVILALTTSLTNLDKTRKE